MTFAQTWERQERLRHQLLLQQVKAEFSAQSVKENPKMTRQAPQPLSSPLERTSSAKPQKNRQQRQARIQAVDIR